MLITGMSFSAIMTGLGIVALAGIVVKNGIVLIDTYNHYNRDDGVERIKAMLLTISQRIRPVLLTATVTALGVIPMALNVEFDFIRREIIVGGIAGSWFVHLSAALVSGLFFLIEGLPDTGTVAAAFERPARPLFLGRKPCLPSRPLVAGWIEAETVHHALAAAGAAGKRAIWPADEGPSGHRTHPLPDLRNWAGSGLHNGTRVVVEGVV